MADSRKIILICAAKGFMVNAMIKNLTEESFEVEIVEPKINELAKLAGARDMFGTIILFYLDGIDDSKQDVMVYMRDMLIEHDGGGRIFLIGNDEEIDVVAKFVPTENFAGVFKRPLNVKELVEHINNAAATADAESAKKHILVVDDDATMLRTLKLWLSDRYRVYMANSGMNAISLLAKNPVDLILLDYEMPVASGPQVLSMIRSEPSTKDTPVMFLTAKNDKESVMSVMELKPEKYLLKTMPPDVLLKNIDEFFESQKGKKL